MVLLVNPVYLTLESQGIASSIVRCNPWPHFVLDDFIRPEEFIRISEEILSAPYGLRINIDDPQRIQYAQLENMELASTFLSIEFVRLVHKLTGRFVLINESNAVQLRRSSIETPAFPVHIDTPSGGESLVAIYYISRSWQPKHGGKLILHRNQSGISDEAIYVEPIPNRLVLFATSSQHWHSVEKVYSEERYSILSEWMFVDV